MTHRDPRENVILRVDAPSVQKHAQHKLRLSHVLLSVEKIADVFLLLQSMIETLDYLFLSLQQLKVVQCESGENGGHNNVEGQENVCAIMLDR